MGFFHLLCVFTAPKIEGNFSITCLNKMVADVWINGILWAGEHDTQKITQQECEFSRLKLNSLFSAF